MILTSNFTVEEGSEPREGYHGYDPHHEAWFSFHDSMAFIDTYFDSVSGSSSLALSSVYAGRDEGEAISSEHHP